MPRGALGPTIAVVALVGATWPAAVRAQPREVTLPRLEVPDEGRKAKNALRPLDRAALLDQPIELSDERDRLTLARERAAWGRLSGSLCSGCSAVRSRGRVATVDPIAVLNARPATAPVALRTVRPSTVAARPGPMPVAAAAAPVPRSGPVLVAAAAAPAALPAAPTPVPATATATATPVAARAAFTKRRVTRPAHAHRVQLAHRRGSRAKLSRYLGKVRYALLRWRHPHRARHPHRIHR